MDLYAYLLGLWVGHNTELPYLIGGGSNQPEPKELWSNFFATWLSRNITDTLENLVESNHRAQWQFASEKKGPTTAHKPVSWQDHFREPICPRQSNRPKKHRAEKPQ